MKEGCYQERPPRILNARKKSLIFQEGDPAFSIYKVVEGEVKLYSQELNGGVNVTGLVYPTQFFGEDGLVSKTHNVSALSVMDSVIKAEPIESFLNKISFDPALRIDFMKQLVRRNEEIANIASMGGLKVPGRVAKAILSYFSEYPDPAFNSQSSLAELVKTARASTTYSLLSFYKAGLISSPRPKYLKIIDRNGLEEIIQENFLF